MELFSATRSISHTGVPTAGSPRITDGAGRVDPINDTTCTIFVGSETFASCDALVAAHPTWHLERADGSSFKNEGDRIQYMNTGK